MPDNGQNADKKTYACIDFTNELGSWKWE